MNYIIDTHVFLWVLFLPEKISKKARVILLDRDATKYVSVITFFEISLKYQLGKIDLKNIYPDNLPSIAKDTGFEFLNLEPETASSFYKLPKLRNKDPFDRMLAWQSISKNCHLLTKDPDFSSYKDHGLKVVW